jgi:hypothetical protein
MPFRAALPIASQRDTAAPLWRPTDGEESASAIPSACAACPSVSSSRRAATAATPNGAAK